MYIVRCNDNTLYTGITTDTERRVKEHNQSPRGASYTRARRPVKLVFAEPAVDRAEASRSEWKIKQLGRKDKETLINRSANT